MNTTQCKTFTQESASGAARAPVKPAAKKRRPVRATEKVRSRRSALSTTRVQKPCNGRQHIIDNSDKQDTKGQLIRPRLFHMAM